MTGDPRPDHGSTFAEAGDGSSPAALSIAAESLAQKFADPGQLRRTFGQFATGVTVVTYEYEGDYYGATVNSFTSVSIDPPLLLVSFRRTSLAAQRLMTRPFTINVLSGGQKATALQFAGTPQENHRVEWELRHGSPQIVGSLAHFSCKPWREYDGGDHVLVLGEVIDFGYAEEKNSLVFYRGQWHSVATIPPQVWLEWDSHGTSA